MPNKAPMIEKLHKAFELYPNDLEYHAKIIREFLDQDQEEFIYDQYSQWIKVNPKAYAANMIYAMLIAEDRQDIETSLKNACSASRTMDTPLILPYEKLLELYETDGRWRDARMVCDEMLEVFPTDNFVRMKLCEVQIYNGTTPQDAYDTLKAYASTLSP